MEIIIITGGWSKERDVSLMECERVYKAMKRLGHNVSVLNIPQDFDKVFHQAAKSDFAYVCLHGGDGMIQEILDRLNCPYNGSDYKGVSLAMNKIASKTLFTISKLPTPAWEIVPFPNYKEWKPKLPFPLVAKPSEGGSSIGVSIVNNNDELEQAIDEINILGDNIILESYLIGEEVSCGVLGDKALPPILIIPKEDAVFFDYKCKYTPGMAEEICPCSLDQDIIENIQELTFTANDILGLKGYSRADFIIKDNLPYLLEVNAQPGMTANSLLPKEAAAAGISFEDIMEQLIKLGINRSGNNNHSVGFTIER